MASIEFNTSTENETEDNHYSNIYHLPSQSIARANTLVQLGTKPGQLTIDYTNQFSEDAKNGGRVRRLLPDPGSNIPTPDILRYPIKIYSKLQYTKKKMIHGNHIECPKPG